MIAKISENNCWFVGRLEYQPAGPLSINKVVDLVKSGAWSVGDWICNPMLDIKWCSILTTHHITESTFKHNHDLEATVSAKPSVQIYNELRDSYPPDLSLHNKNQSFFLQFKGSKFGPLTLQECILLIHSGHLKDQPVFVWKYGMQDWVPIEEIPELTDFRNLLLNSKKKPVNLRSDNRLHLLAKCALHFEDGSSGIGVCHDISKTGIMILTDMVKPLGYQADLEIFPVDMEYFNTEIIQLKCSVIRRSQNPLSMGFRFNHPPKSFLKFFKHP